MPVAAPQKDAQNQILQHYQHLLPKSPSFHLNSQLSPNGLVANSDNYISREDAATLMTDIGPLSALQTTSNTDRAANFFSTHSPPLINLSPSLSPPAEPQRVSPFYDLRETTRKRGLYDLQSSCNQPMQNQTQICSGILPEETGRKSESPSRKRRKTSNSYIDLTNNSPSPPPTWAREATEAARLGVSRRRVSSQRRASGDRRGQADRCNTPRARRSPGTRRRTRERNTSHQNDSSPERRAFQPPNMLNHHQIHPASLPAHLRSDQQSVSYDMEQVPVSAPVTMAPYAIPVCTGPHHMPVCTAAHIPVCNSQPTWSLPGCNVQLPTCNMQHIPACSFPQIPFHPNSIPPLFHHTAHPTASPIAPQHLAPPTQFTTGVRSGVRSHVEEEVSSLLDHRPRFPLPAAFHHQHGAAAFNTSPPVVLQEPHVHPTPHELYGPFQHHYARQRSARHGRLRSVPLPPPPYPGFLLHFLAMLGNQNIPAYSREFTDDATEVENYEALLNLAERLGEAKPKGLTKHEIEQLPAYRFNRENRHSDMDQTSCVVCMCDFENRQLLRVLPCTHEFHAKCVDKWLKTNRTCPICRADATEVASQSD